MLYGLSTFASSDEHGGHVRGSSRRALVLVRPVRAAPADSCPSLCCRWAFCSTRKYATAVVHYRHRAGGAAWAPGVITPLYIQGTCSDSPPLCRVVAMLPGALIGAFMGLVSGRLFDRFGVRQRGDSWRYRGGAGRLGLGAAGHRQRASSTVTITYTVLVVGLQFTMTPLNTWGVNSLDNSVIQHAQGAVKYVEPGGRPPLARRCWCPSRRWRLPVAPDASPRSSRPTSAITWPSCTTFDFDGRSGARHSCSLCATTRRRQPGAAAVTAAERGAEPVDYAAGISTA